MSPWLFNIFLGMVVRRHEPVFREECAWTHARCRSCCLPMIYGCESWVLRDKEKAKLQATEMNVGRTNHEHLPIARSIEFARY